MSQLKETCRLCTNLCNSLTDNIFLLENECFRRLMLKYLSIEISVDDAYSKNVCNTCKCTLGDFDRFAENCSAVQLTLSLISEPLISEATEEERLEPERDFTDSSAIESIDKCSEVDDYTYDSDKLPLSEVSFKSKTNASKIFKIIKLSNVSTKRPKRFLSEIINEEICNEPFNGKTHLASGGELKLSKSKMDRHTLFNSFIDLICHVCLEAFTTWSLLSKHTQITHSTKPQITCVCNKELRSKRSLYNHIMKHDKSAGFRCELCNKRILSEKNYLLHISSHSSHDCSKCGKTFASLDALKAHSITHIPLEERKVHPCEYCDEKFYTKGYVEIHIRSVHNKEKSHMCDICGATFFTNGKLKDHSYKHVTERPFQCPSCSKSFKRNIHLKKHMVCHNDIKFKCPECPSSFNYKATLRQHMCVHRDVYKYTCNICTKVFKWSSAFNSHMNNHTGNTPFSCPWCPKTFRDSGNCCRHKKRSHPIEQAEAVSKKGSVTRRYNTRNINFTKALKPNISNKQGFNSIPSMDSETEFKISKAK